MAEGKKANWFKRFFGGIARFFRELRSELRKVVWPTPRQVQKNTLIVLACVVIVGAFIRIFDYVAGVGISSLLKLKG